MIYYKKSFSIWKSLNDKLFAILASKHIIFLAQQLNQGAEYSVIKLI